MICSQLINPRNKELSLLVFVFTCCGWKSLYSGWICTDVHRPGTVCGQTTGIETRLLFSFLRCPSVYLFIWQMLFANAKCILSKIQRANILGTLYVIIIIVIIIMFNISIAQISIWTWSNALYNSRGYQINIAQITILQFFTNQIKSNVGFWWEGKTGVPGEKPLLTQ